ncbi:MAG: molybdopterin-dependent oxidoreductase [Alphaproteobacteria bacterium]|nr:molybdopterin-dependent oxidoreductase [Alphaproteobacteria bacterium]
MPDFAIPEESTAGKHVGRRMLRVEDRALLKGQGQFVDDIPTKKSTLHAAFLRSPHAHAEIVLIDCSEALKLSGVFEVVIGEDMVQKTDPLIVGFENPIDYHGLAIDKVRYVGEPVAVVAAVDRYRAEDALDLIKIEYKVLPAVVDPLKAAEPEAPLLHPRAASNCVSKRNFIHGDPHKAFAEAEHTAELTIRYPRNSITPIETYAIVAEYVEETDGFDVMSNFQGPFSVHTVMALALRIRTAALRHRSPKNSGGSFGSKLVIFPYIVVLCVLARKVGRPIKWIEDRLEHLSASSVAPNRVTKIEAAYTKHGKLTGLRLTHWDDHGAYLRAPMPAPIYRMHGVSTNGYDIRNLEVTNHIIITNKCPTGAVRGFGGPQLYFAVERMMHKIAVSLGMDPLELIRKNLVKANQFPYQAIAGALFDSGDYHRTIDETVKDGDLAELKKRRDVARKAGRLYGIGYAACIEPSQSNMGYISTLKTGEERDRAGRKDGAVASVTVSVDALGSVNVVGDSVPQGQGHQTALAQIVADQLGLDPKDIFVALDTDTAKDGWSIAAGNYSCRFAPASASAAHEAAQRVRDKMALIAATTLNLPAGDLAFSNGKIHAQNNPDNAIPFYRVGGIAHWSPSSLPDGMEPGIRETSMWNAPELTPTTANDEINTSLAYGFGFDFCGVEVDPDTGVVRVDKYVTAHDCGTILNPGLAEGQIRGSWASGYGASFLEEFCYDDDGSFLSGTFAEYLVPSAAELPDLTLVHPTPNPSPYTRLGAKGIAEGNQYTTPVCIANAVADSLGIEDVQLPLNPARVLGWIKYSEQPPSGRSAPEIVTDGKRPTIDGAGEIEVPAPPLKVWDILLDPNQMAKIVPGCEALEVVGENSFRGSIILGVGPVKGRFDARIELTDLDKPNRANLVGSAIGVLGSSRGNGSFMLTPTGAGTLVKYSYSVELSGKVAAVGGRLIRGAARHLIDRFMRALVRQAIGDEQEAQPRPAGSGSLWAKIKIMLGGGR